MQKLLVLRDPNDGNQDDVLRLNRSREKTYIFDRSFDEYTTQADVYDATVKGKNMVDRVLNGYNCTVFAYGATGESSRDLLSSSRCMGNLHPLCVNTSLTVV